MKSIFVTILLAGMCMACNSKNNGNQVTEPVDQQETNSRDNAPARKPDTLTIAMTGDIMMGTTFPSRQLPPNNGANLFDDTKSILKRADIAVGNLEGTLCNGGTSTKGTGPHSFAFRTPTSYAPLLTDAGYDFLSMANNHANDFGQTGIESTERCLNEQGIKFSGIAGRTQYAVVERNGVKYGICAFGHNRYTMKHADLGLVKSIIEQLKQKSDIVIVSFHGGAEGRDKGHLPQGTETFLGENRGALRDFAHFCIDNGVDVVYGHGPHVTRCVEVYKGRFIAYSLGNFCTPYGMSLGGVLGHAPVVEIKIASDGKFLSGKIHSFTQQRGVGPRRDASNSVARNMADLSRADVPQSQATVDGEGNIKLK